MFLGHLPERSAIQGEGLQQEIAQAIGGGGEREGGRQGREDRVPRASGRPTGPLSFDWLHGVSIP